MNGIDKISARIKADSDAEIADILSRSDAECAGIGDDWARKTREKCLAAAAAGREEADKLYERGCGAARLEAKKRILAEKQKLVDEAFAHAEERLLALPRANYAALCAHLAASSSVSGTETLIFSEKDRDAVGADVVASANALLAKQGRKGALTLSSAVRPIAGGFIMVQGLVETNCSIGAMVTGLRGELSGKVAACLFR